MSIQSSSRSSILTLFAILEENILTKESFLLILIPPTKKISLEEKNIFANFSISFGTFCPSPSKFTIFSKF